MSKTARYLDGFLAAAFPGGQRAEVEPTVAAAQPEVSSLPAPAPLAEVSLPEEEQIKRRLHPLDSFPRLWECAQANRPPTPDDQFRFRWFGLFYQAPERDAFLLRLRLPGGRLQATQLPGLADLLQTHAGGQVSQNAQGGLDIPGVPLRLAPEILRRVESIGLSPRQTGGDGVQNVRGGEYEGLTGREFHGGPVYPLVCALEQSLAHSRHLADLPRGCEVVFQSADGEPSAVQGGPPDVLLVRTTALQPVSSPSGSEPDQETDFLLVVPGGPEGGWRLPASRVVPGCLRLLGAWAAEADRTRRQHAGLADYCHTLPPTQLCALLDPAPWQPLPSMPKRTAPPAAGAVPSGLALPGRRLLSGQLRRIEQVLREHDLTEVRLVGGHLHVPARAGEADPTTALRRALSAR